MLGLCIQYLSADPKNRMSVFLDKKSVICLNCAYKIYMLTAQRVLYSCILHNNVSFLYMTERVVYLLELRLQHLFADRKNSAIS